MGYVVAGARHSNCSNLTPACNVSNSTSRTPLSRSRTLGSRPWTLILCSISSNTPPRTRRPPQRIRISLPSTHRPAQRISCRDLKTCLRKKSIRTWNCLRSCPPLMVDSYLDPQTHFVVVHRRTESLTISLQCTVCFPSARRVHRHRSTYRTFPQVVAYNPLIHSSQAVVSSVPTRQSVVVWMIQSRVLLGKQGPMKCSEDADRFGDAKRALDVTRSLLLTSMTS